MTIKDIARKVVKKINKYKLYVDSVVDPALVIGASNAAMLYGLFKLGESDLSDPTKVLAIGTATIADFYINKKIILPLAKKIREINLNKVKEGLEAKVSSWIKTAALATMIAIPTPYIIKNVKDIFYEIRPTIEKLFYKGIDVSNVNLAKKESYLGRIQRTERWKCLCEIYEEKYGIPKNIICAIIMEESYGDPTAINKKDGGAGLIHIQPATAKQWGLKVYQDSNAIASKDHSEELIELIKSKNYDLDKLKEYDDRFDIEKVISKIAEKLREYYDKFGTWDAAIAAINTGPGGVYDKGNFTKRAKKYLKKINKWKKIRENNEIMAEAIKDFNERNRKQELTFNMYVGWFQEPLCKN